MWSLHDAAVRVAVGMLSQIRDVLWQRPEFSDQISVLAIFRSLFYLQELEKICEQKSSSREISCYN